MTLWQWALVALAALAAVVALCAVTLIVIKRRASRLADHAPEIALLCRTLIDDPRVPFHHKLVLRALAGYLELPLDLIPDFIPLIGRLDDALVAALAIRFAMRIADPELIAEHWPGPQDPPAAILRRGGRRRRTARRSATVLG
jgi:uncharacterized membrane protein YkvA (DUF1232 family)